MSYILDALRRAEAERERGAVPSLASQQHSIEVEDEAPERPRTMLWAVIGLAFALAATLAWAFLGNRGTPSRPIAEGAATPAPTSTTTSTPMPVPPAVPQSLAEIAGVPSASITPAPAPAPAVTPQSIAPTFKPPPAPRAQAQAQAIAPAPRPAATPATKPGTAGAASEPRVYAQSELPDDIRRDLPRITVNGSSYSGDAASRMVMINGQVFHEGDTLGAGLVLDKIRRRSAVLMYRGYRYELMF